MVMRPIRRNIPEGVARRSVKFVVLRTLLLQRRLAYLQPNPSRPAPWVRVRAKKGIQRGVVSVKVLRSSGTGDLGVSTNLDGVTFDVADLKEFGASSLLQRTGRRTCALEVFPRLS
jgi:hypothetical protein